ncbi:GDNF family receptor alpha-like [Hypomesus transpacificus]|uniref:GDNF family receptor alpha-like n=1 Tax=Hypomesus transpacificus TaxID=137520 RepID=UPI001F079431|nr:GDNF family receptor alpha-like [Hypomesus transpacificus]
MQRKAAVETAILLGVVMSQLSSIRCTRSPPSCQQNWETCMAHFCSSNQTILQHICKDGACQMKGWRRCALTLRSLTEGHPDLRPCLCPGEGERPCALLRQLHTHCLPHTHTGTIAEQKMTPPMDWETNRLQDPSLPGLPGPSRGGSCLQQMSVCIQDNACNRQLVPVIQTCSSKPCQNSQCARVTQAFYRGLAAEVALGLGMCQCEPGDLDCQGVQHTLHSGSCGAEEEEKEERTCLEEVDGCLEDSTCRPVLEGLLSQCWSEEDRPCSASLSSVCLSLLDPTLLLRQHPGCLSALVATAGTPLRQRCTCRSLDQHGLLRCTALHHALLNHSLYQLPVLEATGSSHQPDLVSGPQTHSWMSDQLLCILAYVLLVVAVLPGAVLVVYKLGREVWLSYCCNCRTYRGAEKATFQPPEKRSSLIVT